jgi:hypothetical protein
MHNLIYLLIGVFILWIVSNAIGGKYTLHDKDQDDANQASLDSAHSRYPNLKPRERK